MDEIGVGASKSNFPSPGWAVAGCLSETISSDGAATHGKKLSAWQEQRVLRLIEEKLADGLCRDDLATAAKLSANYFCRLFKNSFGVSPQAYVRQCRVERAKVLMASTDTPLVSIALQCGFSDQPHMGRIFHQLVGRPPGFWRREQAGRAPRSTSL